MIVDGYLKSIDFVEVALMLLIAASVTLLLFVYLLAALLRPEWF